MIIYIPKSIESFIAAIDSKDWCSSVGFSHSSISLKYDDFGPYLIVNAFPFPKHFFDVVLENRKFRLINCRQITNYNIGISFKNCARRQNQWFNDDGKFNLKIIKGVL